MRQIVLDTETTGLNAATGDRVIEIGCVELVNRRLTGRNLHFYINPEREIDAGAMAVHGITNEFVADKPKFAEVVAEIRDYVQGAEAIIHNAAFDLGFLDMEFRRLGLPSFREHLDGHIDTLLEARRMFPGKRNSLDALCDRLGVSNAHRTLHGALLDAELLAEVYLAMTRGQNTLVIDMLEVGETAATEAAAVDLSGLALPILLATEAEAAAHATVLKEIDKASGSKTVWSREAQETAPQAA
ncbi:DNA polymerase III subunit epsilon [Ralstonia solanacearum]|uniref:DNA polymerase III subunit epsilon n=1 Tax=Ralstonia solanacearum K60 TaxID=1091042 RepID=A0AAP7ZQH3_RALSL|nr:DNA polymerase III subunit epsilon [Ralstonia solanacearum]MBT1538435.1 DNA polymerase III subunit epsilon [Ralstonia solanacearum]OYQ14668.1 DNA polymerase III subunit epsilon [Ralstonia solanacearum K60]QOK82042.1 DNA polymerase III subunit epsilon [Ralstonia solanacearum]RIJ85555.1 DNA polymerase III subunit epsilon [Ralstonia solanacearum]CCF95684.1 DNA polymerase III epsilon subunit [Ralstonia solanacearum K60]